MKKGVSGDCRRWGNGTYTKYQCIYRWLFLLLLITVGAVYGERNESSEVKRVIKFEYPDFSDLSQWMLNKDTFKYPVDDQGRKVLRLTQSKRQQAGSAFITERILLEGEDGFKGSFSAFFSFRIHDNRGWADAVNDNLTGADGLAFVVQTESNTAGSVGAGMGYLGILHSVAVEFDTWNNNNMSATHLASDSNYNHVGIYAQQNSSIPVGSFSTLDTGKGLMKNGEVWYAWVDYNGTTQVLEARISSRDVRPIAPFHTEKIDLPAVLERPDVFVGFTSATGDAHSNHDILSFYFTNKHDPYKENLIDDHTFTIPEKSPEGTNVGTVSLVDNVTGDITLKLLDKVPAEFTYTKSNGKIVVAPGASLIFDEKSSYSFRIEAYKKIVHTPEIIDEVYDTATITINLKKPQLPSFIYANTQKQYNGLNGAFNNRVIFTTATHKIALKLKDKDGKSIPLSDTAKIFFTRHNKKADSNSKVYKTPIYIGSSDTIRAIAHVRGYKNPVQGFWVYEQQLPKGNIIALPSVDTPGVYTFSTEQLDVNLALVSESGDTLYPSDSIAFYYTLGNTQPVIGDASTKEFSGSKPISIAGDDTLRAIAISKHFTVPDEGVWYYNRELPEAMLKATPGNSTVYIYDKPSLDVTLQTNVGNTIYYTLDGSDPKVGTSDSLSSHIGDVTIYGDDTLRALAVGSAYREKDSLWIYDSQLPQLYLEADAGGVDGDSTTFYFDTTITLRARNSAGDEVRDARIFYRFDTTHTATIDSTEGVLYSDTLTTDTTVTLQAVAYHPEYKSVSAAWHYTLLYKENSLEVHTFDTAWESGELIKGDVLFSENDTAHFGHNLQIVIESDAETVEYLKDGVLTKYYVDDTVYLDDSDKDTTIVSVTSYGQGFKKVTKEFVFVRDTVTGIRISPPGKKFTTPIQELTLSLSQNKWKNPVIYFDTSGTFEQYSKTIEIERSRELRAFANADFAVESDTLIEEYIKAISIAEAYYFDADGDGAIDSARIVCSDSLSDLPDSILLSDPFRQAEVIVTKYGIKRESEHVFSVLPDAPFQFSGSTGFTSAFVKLFGETFSEDEYAVKDSVAPVLLSGALFPGEIITVDPITRAADSLYLVYSEQIALDDSESPVVVYSYSDESAYTLSTSKSDIKTVDTLIEGKTYRVSHAWFLIDEYKDSLRSPQKGDSINIAVRSSTRDTNDVAQQLIDNRKVPLYVGDIPYRLHIQALSPVDPETYMVPGELQIDAVGENGLVIVCDFLIPLDNNNQDGTITILDNIGNEIKRCSGRKDVTDGLAVDVKQGKTTKLLFQWDGTNNAGRKVGTGAYIVELSIEDGRGNTHNSQIVVGIQRE